MFLSIILVIPKSSLKDLKHFQIRENLYWLEFLVHDELSKINTLPLHFGKSITGSHGGDCSPENDIPRYLNL